MFGHQNEVNRKIQDVYLLQFQTCLTSSDQWQFWCKHIWDSWRSGGRGGEARGASASRLGHVVLTHSLSQPWGGTQIHWVKNINALQEWARDWQHTAWQELSHILKITSSPSFISFPFKCLLLSSLFFFFCQRWHFTNHVALGNSVIIPVCLKVETEPWSFGRSGSTFVNPCCLPSLEAIMENIFRMRQSE